MNRRVDIREDIKRYQDTLSYALSKIDYSVGENIYMLPSDMNLKIKTATVGYNNKILVSDEKFSLGKNENVNALVLEEPVMGPSHDKAVAQQTQAKKPNISHEEQRIALILFLTGGFVIWNIFLRNMKNDIVFMLNLNQVSNH